MTYDFDDLVKKECETCTKTCLVFPCFNNKVECHNCYITKLELLKREKKNSEQEEAKVLKLKRKY